MFSTRKKKLDLPTTDEALPGRAQPLSVPARHFVNGNRLEAPFPAGMQLALFGLGCFWGAERKFSGAKYSSSQTAGLVPFSEI